MLSRSGKPDRRRWIRWISRITNEVAKSAVERYIFDRWWAIIQSNPQIDINNRFIALIWSSYFDRQTLVVRRHVKVDRNSISFVRLLKDVAEHDKYITRHEFLQNYANNPYFDKAQVQQNVCEASRLFDSFAGRGKPHISRSRVQKDINQLKRETRRLEYFADKWLAHSDRKRKWPRLGFKELNKALDLLFKTWQRYHEIIRGSISVDPAFLAGTEWEEVLTVPWKSLSR